MSFVISNKRDKIILTIEGYDIFNISMIIKITNVNIAVIGAYNFKLFNSLKLLVNNILLWLMMVQRYFV
jgi:hypothetical protein